jgi:predicted DNA-binding transcriptional regulator AlpA
VTKSKRGPSSQIERSIHRYFDKFGWGPRRGLRRDEAAAYVGLSARKFDQLIADGRMPKGKRVDGCVVFDIVALDAAFEALGDEGPEVNEWDG